MNEQLHDSTFGGIMQAFPRLTKQAETRTMTADCKHHNEQGEFCVQPAFKRKWKNCLIMMIIALSLSLIGIVINVTGGFRYDFRAYMIWEILGFTLGCAAILTCALISLRFSYQGRRYASVVFSSIFGVFLLAAAFTRTVSSVQTYLWYGRYGDFVRDGLPSLLNAVAFCCLCLLTVDFYVFSHIAPRYNGSACGIIALVLTVLWAVCRLGVLGLSAIARAESGPLNGYAILALVQNGLYCAVLLLTGLALSIGMGRVRRAKRTPVPDEPMCPVLEEYRASLRKERA